MPKSIELTSQALGEICLGYLAENPTQLAEFMGLTGYTPNALRKVAGTPELDSGLIDYFAQNEPFSSPAPLPAWPAAAAASTETAPGAWPSLTVLPSSQPTAPATVPFTPFVPAASARPLPEESDFTDDDLREAFGPIVEQAVRKAVYAQENGIDTYLEPMLRSTIRRALAEYAPTRPFRAPGFVDRLFWHLQALFTSRTYDEIVFEKTHRFQVEEVFLVDAASLALISFASSDPARHASAKRVSNTVQRLALQVRDENGKIRETFELPEQRQAVSLAGRFVVLIAVVRGVPGELVMADLDFALRRIEDRFREKFLQDGSPLLHPLQPFLEDCLLIQAPASAA
ncbi:MAG: DUF3572 family protein [Verrucomicrobiaceae bacterium]|nr:MAG: DUF3572 family protein [Verrucomicrobiaceae bacterium]